MKITKFSSMLMLIAIMLFSCLQEKEANISTNSEFTYDLNSQIQYSQINVLTKGFAVARGGKQMLVFPDQETFLRTV